MNAFSGCLWFGRRVCNKGFNYCCCLLVGRTFMPDKYSRIYLNTLNLKTSGINARPT
ncbi:hypothetical protein GCWU000324_01379 [Kingella oralis ATCC 51147]|uniref:Uncharacterized protein n=1 Tax=Kingella oralis ATCC 51147 TaxID=629741 RepID=C4GGW0_9NEIS|nr:hypothetical protein GCWU000324_01379 [Kingella oralis ATCC 51147]